MKIKYALLLVLLVLLAACNSEDGAYASYKCYGQPDKDRMEKCFLSCVGDIDKISDEGADWVSECASQCRYILCDRKWVVFWGANNNSTLCSTRISIKLQKTCQTAGWEK